MKKLGIVTLVLVLLLGLGAMSAYAKAQKVDLEPYTANPQYAELTGGGFVIFNNSSDPNNLEVTISVKKADTSISGTELDVWLYVGGVLHQKYTGMTLNAKGNGNFHINTSVEPGITHELFVVLTERGEGANMFRAPGATGSHIEMDFK